MKFYFGVLTTGFLIATAAAGPFPSLNVLANNFGTLGDVVNLAPSAQSCSGTSTVGTLGVFAVADENVNYCPSLPCLIEKGKGYGLAFFIRCGAIEMSYKLKVSINGGTSELTLNQNTGDVCLLPGNDALITFGFGIPVDATNGIYSLQLRLVGSSNLNESCMKVGFNVTNPAM